MNEKQAWINTGLRLEKQRRFKEALECYEKAIALDPNFAVAWNNKGVVLGVLERVQEELDCYNKAVTIMPNFGLAWRNKANALGKLGRIQEAIKCYDTAIAINPRDKDAWFNKGIILIPQEKIKTAEIRKAMNNISRILKTDASKTHYEEKIDWEKVKEALGCFEKVVEIDPNDQKAWTNMGYILRVLGRIQEALKCLNFALTLKPMDEVAMFNKSQALEALGKSEEADRYRNEILKLKFGSLTRSPPQRGYYITNRDVEKLIEPDSTKGIIESMPTKVDMQAVQERMFEKLQEKVEKKTEQKRFCVDCFYFFDEWSISDLRILKQKVIYSGLCLLKKKRVLTMGLCPDFHVLISPSEHTSPRYQELHQEAIVVGLIRDFQKVDNWQQHTKSIFSQGYTAYNQGLYKEAIYNFEQILKINPNFLLAWYYLGHIYHNLQNNYKALEALDNLLHLDPFFKDAWVFKAQIYDKLGYVQEQCECLEKVVQIDLEDQAAWFKLSQLYQKVGDIKNSVNSQLNFLYLRSGVEAHEKSSQMVKYLMLLEEINPNNQYQFKPKNAEDWGKMAIFCIESKRYKNAIECFEKVLEIEPNNSWAWYNMGVCYDNLKDFQKAKEIYQKTLEIEPTDTRAMINLAIIYQHLHSYLKSVEYAENAAELDSENVDAWIVMAQGYEKLKNYPKAFECSEKAAELDPNDQEAWYLMGLYYQRVNNPQKVIECFSKTLNLDPSNKDIWFKMGLIYTQLNDIQKAINCFEHAGFKSEDLRDKEKFRKKIFNKMELEEEEIEALEGIISTLSALTRRQIHPEIETYDLSHELLLNIHAFLHSYYDRLLTIKSEYYFQDKLIVKIKDDYYSEEKPTIDQSYRFESELKAIKEVLNPINEALTKNQETYSIPLNTVSKAYYLLKYFLKFVKGMMWLE